MRRVVVTGLGIISCIGNNQETVIKNLKKIIFLFLLIFPNKLYASFFEDLTSQIVENPKRLSYGVSTI